MKSLSLSVDYEKPEKKIEAIIKNLGVKDVRCQSSFSDARVDFRIDDSLDARVFKTKVCNELNRNGFRAR